MKKLFAFISVLAVATVMIFADVTVKDLGGGNVEVTFFYGNPRASEVVLAGDFTNWLDGAWPMEKTEKGFTLTHNFKVTDELRYKFVSDGNWTTDLKAPDFVDDGFGGKNSHVVIADMVGGDSADAAKAKINFISWTMIGTQGNFLTQSETDATKKGFDFDSLTVGMKSYNKFAGNFLPNCPVYIEIALAETELEDYEHEFSKRSAGNLITVASKNRYDEDVVGFEDGFKNFINGIFGNPVAYLARANDNTAAGAGPGSNPFLGHLKFGFNTPYVKFLTGFNYAKPDLRTLVIWNTVSGAWDAGYQHVGGFNVFSLGDKPAAFLEEKTGIKFDLGFAPNRTADRKGTQYGYWGWATVQKNDFVVDFQTNGMYGNDYLFYDPVEHDFILGAKYDNIGIGNGKLNVAAQYLLATHQKSSEDIVADGASNVTDYFGYSTDVFYRSGDFDGIQNMAAEVRGKYKLDNFEIGLGYKFRGMQASMLYVRENHDDGTFDLSEMLGRLNSQNINLGASTKLLDGALGLNLGVNIEMPLEVLASDSDGFKGYMANLETWYAARCEDKFEPRTLLDAGSVEMKFTPGVSYAFGDLGLTVGAYADLHFRSLKATSVDGKDDFEADEASKYSYADSAFAMDVAGFTANWAFDNDIVKGLDVYYGFDMSNSVRILNTVMTQVKFPADMTATVAFGIKTENTFSEDSDENPRGFKSDANNPFAFAIGFSKRFKAMKKPTVYAQFVYNMDPFKHFGDGQEALNLDRANMKGSWAKEAACGSIDPVDWYDGQAAMRVGIRWDI